MARAVWNGSISFGLVSIPVKLYPATSPRDVRFHQFDRASGRRVRYRRVVPEVEEARPSVASPEPPPPASAPGLSRSEDAPRRGDRPPVEDDRSGRPESEVAFDDIVKGYEVEPGRFVMVDPEELRALRPEKSRAIEIEEFVALDEIDPVYFDKSYHLIPGSDPVARKPYALLLAALEEAGRVGIGRFVLRTKEHLVAIRPRMGVLGLETLFYADEVQEPPETWRIPRQVVRPREVEMAVRLIESLAAEWDPARYTDTQRARILELLAEREPTLAPEEPVGEAAPSRLPNLMEALRASVEAAKEARKEAQADVRPKGGKGRRPA